MTSYFSFICKIVALQVADGVSPFTYVIVEKEKYASVSTISFVFRKSSHITIFFLFLFYLTELVARFGKLVYSPSLKYVIIFEDSNFQSAAFVGTDDHLQKLPFI